MTKNEITQHYLNEMNKIFKVGGTAYIIDPWGDHKVGDEGEDIPWETISGVCVEENYLMFESDEGYYIDSEDEDDTHFYNMTKDELNNWFRTKVVLTKPVHVDEWGLEPGDLEI